MTTRGSTEENKGIKEGLKETDNVRSYLGVSMTISGRDLDLTLMVF